MTIGRTKDLEIWLATASAAHNVTNLLGMSVNGSADVTNEDYLGRELELASVHAVGTAFEFSTLYDTAANDAVIAGLLGDAYSSGVTPPVLMVFQDGGVLSHWQAHPVSFARPGVDAPAADAITRPWSLGAQGRGAYGLTVMPFTTNPAGSAVEVLAAAAARPDDPVAYVLVTDIGTATALTLADGTTNHNLEEDDGVQVIDLDGAAAALTIDSSTAAAEGYVLVGSKEVVASG